MRKIDVDYLKTFTNYGKSLGISRQAIHQAAREGRVHVIEIDGIKFVNTAPSKSPKKKS